MSFCILAFNTFASFSLSHWRPVRDSLSSLGDSAMTRCSKWRCWWAETLNVLPNSNAATWIIWFHHKVLPSLFKSSRCSSNLYFISQKTHIKSKVYQKMIMIKSCYKNVQDKSDPYQKNLFFFWTRLNRKTKCLETLGETVKE